MPSKLRPVILDLAYLLAALPAVSRYFLRLLLIRLARLSLWLVSGLALGLLLGLQALHRLCGQVSWRLPRKFPSLQPLPCYGRASAAGAALLALVFAAGLTERPQGGSLADQAGAKVAAPDFSLGQATAGLSLAGKAMTSAALSSAAMTSVAGGEAARNLAGKQSAVLPREAALLPASLDLADLELGLADLEAEAPENSDRTLKVRRGDTLMSLLNDAGVANSDAHQAVAAMRDLFSPRDLRPGQAIHLALAAELPDEQGSAEDGVARLVSMTLQPDPERDIKVVRDAGKGGYLAKAVARPLTLELTRGAGLIESSLFDAGLAAAVPLSVTIEAIRVFSYDVDFQREIRKGDAFEFLYESRIDSEGRVAKTGEVLFAGLTLSGQDHEAYRFMPESGFADYFDAQGQSIRKALLKTPIDGARLSSGFGLRRHPILGYNKMHRGLDFAAPSGTPVYAAGNGSVERAGRNGGYGNYVRIRHNSTYKTAYAHLSRFAKGLRQGDKVKQGDVIGYVGTTGRSTGPHLHYEVLIGSKQVNPQKLDLPRGEQLEGKDLKRFLAERQRIDRLREERAPAETRIAAACPALPDGVAKAGPGC